MSDASPTPSELIFRNQFQVSDWNDQEHDKHWLSLFSIDQANGDPSRPWAGVARATATKYGGDNYASLADFIDKLSEVSPTGYSCAAFFFIDQTPSNDQLELVATTLNKILQSQIPASATSNPFTLVIWLQLNLVETGDYKSLPQIVYKGGGLQPHIDDSIPFQWFKVVDANTPLTLQFASSSILYAVDDRLVLCSLNQHEKFGLIAAEKLSLGVNPGAQIPGLAMKLFPQIYVPAASAAGPVGAMQFNATVETAFSTTFKPGFHYNIEASSTENTQNYQLDYPLLEKPDGMKGRELSCLVDLLAISDPSRTRLQFTNSDSIVSGFRTLLGSRLTLSPVIAPQTIDNANTSELNFSQSASGYFSLFPNGDFAIGIAALGEDSDATSDAGAPPATTQLPGLDDYLVCGFSGTESINLLLSQDHPGSEFIRFIPGQAASVKLAEDRFSPLDSTYTTPWVALWSNRGASAGKRWYNSEPAIAPLFGTELPAHSGPVITKNTAGSGTASHSGGSESETKSAPAVLDFYNVTQYSLPEHPATESNCYPMVPYAGYATPPPSTSDNVSDLEYQVLAVTRGQRIRSLSGSTTLPVYHANAPASAVTLTPQGTLAEFSKGNWTSLTFAESQRQFIQTTGSPALPQPVQEAFLTNQQCIVFSINKNGNFGALSFALKMGGWAFNLQPPESQVVGDYRNVIIFKSANKSLKELLNNPATWTNYADFNDAVNDPSGQYLSRWCSDYIKAAESAYKEGDVSFKNFCKTVSDPHWSGFLALKATINPKGFDDDLYPLLGGIDLSRFYAHHVGNEATRPVPTGSAVGHDQIHDGNSVYDLQSSLFALVHYKDESYNPLAGIPAFVNDSNTHNFKVLALTALFLKSGIASFNSKLLLTLNSLLQSKVIMQPSTKVGTVASDELVATNRLVLDGGVQKNGDVAVYNFSTPEGSENYFYLSSGAIAQLEITKSVFSLVSTDGSVDSAAGKKITSQFAFWGNLKFCPGPELQFSPAGIESTTTDNSDTPLFDIFSFDRLAYQKLALTMEFVLTEDTSKNPPEFHQSALSFTPDTRDFVIPNLPVLITQTDNDYSAGTNYVRAGSLVSQFPMKFKQFIVVGQDDDTSKKQTPEDFGYGPMDCPPFKRAQLSGDMGNSWYGIVYEFQLGSMGALAPSVVFTAEALFAWDPVNDTRYVGIQLPGLGPLDKLLDIEGIIKFGAEQVRFDRVQVTAECNDSTATVSDVTNNADNEKQPYLYVIQFASIGLHVLSLSFPAAGSTNVSVFGDPCLDKQTLPNTLGWFGSYIQPGLEPEPEPESAPAGTPRVQST